MTDPPAPPAPVDLTRCTFLGCTDTPAWRVGFSGSPRPWVACSGHVDAMAESGHWGQGGNAQVDVTPL